MKKNITRKNKPKIKNISFKPVKYTHLLGKVKGIDDKLLKIHFKLYEGLVGATNGALKFIQSQNTSNMVEFSAIQKEFSLFYNGMRLHELYFGVMCGENMDKMDPTWINEFNIGEIIGADILLVMDMWEHAYISEFGLNLNKYSNTFLNNVNWSVVSRMYNDSVNNKANALFDTKHH